MRHLRKNKKFGRLADYRKAFLWGMVEELIVRGKIKTMSARAKTVRSMTEKAITRAKTDNLANRRLLLKRLHPPAVAKLFGEVAPAYKERAGGYTRIVKWGTRKNDSAHLSIVELIK